MLKNFFLTLLIFLGIDFVWLGLIAKNFYDKVFSPFSRTLNLPAAFLSYFLIALGITVFVLPKVPENSPVFGLIWGGIFGLIVYGVYDLVNLATLADWSIKMVIVDMLWGVFVCGFTSFLVAFILTRLK